MIISIHQPNFFPYLGYFDKFVKSDIFVILDHVQFTKNGYQNRNKVNTFQGPLWLTVPVKYNLGQSTNSVLIDNSRKWQIQHYRTIIQNYSKSSHLQSMIRLFDQLYSKHWKYLIDFNMEGLNFLFATLKSEHQIIYSSQLPLANTGSDMIMQICLELRADTYYSGKSGSSYLDLAKFSNNGIQVVFQDFRAPIYSQLHGDHTPGLSSLDFVLNEGLNGFKNLLFK